MAHSKTVVLIHGNFVNNTSWTDWSSYYKQRGYSVYTPANPGHEGIPKELRTKIHPELINTGFREVVNNLAKIIDGLPEKPLIIGHSMAGMAVLKLVEMGKAAAAVNIDGAPPKNVFPPFQTLKTVLPAFGFFSSKNCFLGSRKWYDYAFFNTIPETEKAAAYEKYAVPESYKVSRQLVLDSFSNIDFEKPHVPILFIAGGQDHIFPSSLTQTIAGRYSDLNSRVDLKIYDDKSHFICGEPGWQNISSDVLNWFEGLKKST
jgi:pimeloyl-ACP methyl ester carboxylesterase